MAGIDGDPVRDVQHRGRDAAEPQAFLDAERRADVAPCAERRSGAAERTGDDDPVAGSGARSPRHALRTAERGDADDDLARPRRVAAPKGTPGSPSPS